MNKIGQFEILNSKAIKKIMQDLKEQFEYDEKLNYAFLKNKKEKILIINKDIDEVGHEKLRIDALGLYFGKYYNDGFRLSIEGTQLIGPKCKKNIIEINQEQKHAWLKGENIQINKENGFVIIKTEKDFLGCAKVKNSEALNSVPKARTLKNVNEEITEN